jgi:hypothetical protein
MSAARPILLSLGLLATLPAETITWFCDPVSVNRAADGQPMDGFFRFQLGAFAAGFEPTPSNAAQWASNWVPAATADYHEGNRLFHGSFTLTANTAPFAVNAKAWIRGFRDAAAGGDWILFRAAGWRWPAANPLNPPLRQWNTRDATEVVLGRVDPTGSPFLMQAAEVATYEQWRTSVLAGHPSGSAGDDADGDGVANFLEFVLGSRPDDPSSVVRPPVSMVEVAGRQHLQMTVPRVPGRLFAGAVEVSGDLSDWRSGAPFTVVVSDAAEGLVVRDVAPIGPSNPKRFIRFKADEP